MLALLHFRKNAGLFNLLFETAQSDIEAVVVFVKVYSGKKLTPFSAGYFGDASRTP